MSEAGEGVERAETDGGAGMSRRRALVLGAGGAGLALMVRGTFLDGPTVAAAPEVVATCSLMQEVTQGPYYLDETTLLRSDIRETQTGVPLVLTLTVVSTSTSCAAVEGAVVEIWHANANGIYSGYAGQPGGVSTVGQTYLRGAQVSDANGQVTFTTIYPGWYSGRAVHIHVKVHVGSAVHTGQLFFDDTITTAVYANNAPYNTRGTRDHLNSGDSIYKQATATALVSLTQTASNYSAFTGTNILGVTDAVTTPTTTNPTVTPTTTPSTVATTTAAFAALAAPQRLLDTRTSTKPSAGTTLTVPIAGQAGIPSSGVAAVVLNLTVTETGAAGYLRAWGDGTMPETSNLNVAAAGQTRAVLATVPVGADGAVRLWASVSTHVVVDVFGYYAPASTAQAGRLQSLTPDRILDTRNAIGYSGAIPAAGATTTLQVLGRGGVPTSGVQAVALNVTITEAVAPGYVTVYPDDTRPATSNVNTVAGGESVANQVIIPVGADGSVRLFNNVSMHLVADVVGWFTDASAATSAAGLFTAVSPYRVLDTRDSLGRRPAGDTVTLLLAAAGTAASGAAAVVGNITGVDNTGDGFVTVYPDGARPTTSTLNLTGANDIRANHVIAVTGSDGGIRIYNFVATQLVFDVYGWYSA
ncbi:MAG: intradiol ring-cleavage dioxygenase [Ilumatobacteraceae bacterium]